MTYLEYHKQTNQVVEIHATPPNSAVGYDYGISDAFDVSDEFEWTIWINEVDENKNVVSYSAIRNNPNAKRLLQENAQLKAENEHLRSEDLNNKEAIAELYLLSVGDD